MINRTILVVQINAAIQRFNTWKVYRVTTYDTIYNWEDSENEKNFALELTHTDNVEDLI